MKSEGEIRYKLRQARFRYLKEALSNAQEDEIETLKSEIKDFFRTRSAAEVAVKFPDVAALMWVLDGSSSIESEVFPNEFEIQSLKVENSKLREDLNRHISERSDFHHEVNFLKASLYEKEKASFGSLIKDSELRIVDQSMIIQNLLQEVKSLRTQIEAPMPWYLALYKRFIK